MKTRRYYTLTLWTLLLLGGFLGVTGSARAHCDTMDGPLVIEAKAALEKGDLTPLLKWVKPEGEAEVKLAFNQAVKVRSKGSEAKDLADRYFLETLVRVHRAGEGAAYGGLKPAGQQEGIIVAADQALVKESAEAVRHDVVTAVSQGILERYQRALELKQHANESVAAGRQFIAAYVEYMHYVERLHQDAGSAAHDEAKAAGRACCNHHSE